MFDTEVPEAIITPFAHMSPESGVADKAGERCILSLIS